MTMTKMIAEDILQEEFGDEYREVVAPSITGSSRWSIEYEAVYMYIPTETYWLITWTRGATEYQDNGAEDVEFVQVVPVAETVIRYVPKE